VNLRVWGTRGGLPVPGAATTVFGGNTSCIEVRCGAHVLILDAGSGLRGLGQTLRPPFVADLLLTHTHLDHVCGLPFFAPMFQSGAKVKLWGGHLPRQQLLEALTSMLSPPLMPDLLGALPAPLHLQHFHPGARLTPKPGVIVETAPLNHPGGAIGYRVSADGKTLAYVTDTEHPATGFDRNAVALAKGAGVMIYDAYFDAADYPRHVGWGHSTWQHGVELAAHAGVGKLVLFHHNINYDDSRLARIEEAADRLRPGTVVAREGLCLTL